MFHDKRILCISAHMDDIEFGCGGLVKSLEDKAEIFLLILSKDRKSSKGVVQEIRDLEEQFCSSSFLGVKKENIFFVEGVPGQLFPEYRQQILEEMYRVDALINPHFIFVPSRNDVHQDHRTVYNSSLKAFKRKTIIAYEIVNSTEKFSPSMFVEISEESLNAKINAISCYKSQNNSVVTTGDYFDADAIKGLARIRGARVGARYAEAFEVVNMMVRQEI